MKKLNKITAALASLALAATAFVGCAYNHPDLDPQVDLGSFYLRGNMNNWGNDDIKDGELKANGDGTYSITYTAKAADDEFAIADKGWGTKFCDGKSVSIDGTFVSLPSGGSNAKITGQIPGDNYKLTVKPSTTSVSVKVEKAGSNSAAFYLVDDANGLVKLTYDGKIYTGLFTAAKNGAAQISIWSNDKYYYSDTAISKLKDDAVTLSASETKKTTTTPTLEKDNKYKVIVTPSADKKTYTLAVANGLIDLSKSDWVGDMSNDGLKFADATYDKDKNSWTFDLNYQNSMSAWGGGNGVCNFKIRKVAGDWSGGDYGYGKIKIGKLAAGLEIVDPADGNIQLKGLVDGTKYKVTFSATDEEITFEIAK